jgi:hypothetical protein
VLDVVVEVAEKTVEQVAEGGGMAVSLGAAAVVLGSCWGG